MVCVPNQAAGFTSIKKTKKSFLMRAERRLDVQFKFEGQLTILSLQWVCRLSLFRKNVTMKALAQILCIVQMSSPHLLSFRSVQVGFFCKLKLCGIMPDSLGFMNGWRELGVSSSLWLFDRNVLRSQKTRQGVSTLLDHRTCKKPQCYHDLRSLRSR